MLRSNKLRQSRVAAFKTVSRSSLMLQKADFAVYSHPKPAIPLTTRKLPTILVLPTISTRTLVEGCHACQLHLA